MRKIEQLLKEVIAVSPLCAMLRVAPGPLTQWSKDLTHAENRHIAEIERSELKEPHSMYPGLCKGTNLSRLTHIHETSNFGQRDVVHYYDKCISGLLCLKPGVPSKLVFVKSSELDGRKGSMTRKINAKAGRSEATGQAR